MRFSALAALALLAALPAAGQIYKWTDSSGKVVYGDRPPEDAKKQEVRIAVPSYEGPVEVRDWGAVLRGKSSPGKAAAPGMPSITMYATSWCGHCRRAREYFASRGIAYTEVDVEASPEGNRRFKELGGKGVPLIVAGDKVMRGFSPDGFEQLLARK